MRIKILVIAVMMSVGVLSGSGLAIESARPMVVGFDYGMTISDKITPNSVRETLNIDFDWKFALGHAADIDKDFDYWGGDPASKAKTGDPAGPANPSFNDNNWQIIDIPHDWVVGLDYNQLAEERHAYKEIGRRYPQNSIGWYRKTFKTPKEDLGKRITVEFDGIFRDSKVWLNGHPMSSHESGYTSFSFDVTDYLKYGGENTITVRADAKLIDKDGKIVYLSSLKPIRQSQGWGELGFDVSVQGNRLRINGREFSHGLGTHSQGELVFDLNNKYEYFETWVGVDDEAAQEGSVQFKLITK